MFKHPPRELLPSDPQFYRRLTEDEKWILNDISAAFQVIHYALALFIFKLGKIK
jgi:hypothetical protein